jgi:protein-L-isoaspartate(D-aspartate) O-methyltransferase
MEASLKSDALALARHDMVERQIRRRGIKDRLTLEAMECVARHLFVPEAHQRLAYEDSALPIGSGQSISQPYMVAAMTEALEPLPASRILEIGTGSGYQTAVLAQVVAEVFTVERLPELSREAQTILDDIGYQNISFKIGDGSQGWPEEAPFDGILVTAGAARLPEPLLDQLANGASLVIPLGGPPDQDLYQIKREGEAYKERFITRCRFVPLIEG